MSAMSSDEADVLAGVTVYLAEPTDDLESEYENIRDSLAALGADVRPWRYHSATDPDSFAADLALSIAFIQLLSDVPGRRISPNDRLPAFQYSLATAAKLPIFQWRSSPSSRAGVDPAHQELLSGANVRVGPLAGFRSELRTALARLKAKQDSPEAAAPDENEEQEDRPRNGRILTFYSYKGGTGRSMALANAAWILASNGMRVLAIDWDFEAPGLHRYFRPFLDDPELANTPGLIDFFTNFVETCHIAGDRSDDASPDQSQFVAQAALGRYAVSLDYDFAKDGRLDLVGAGQQGGSYGLRVNSFRWDTFYEKLGGGVFLEMMKEQLRRTYDYILIDSRTGLSDTSGICTVQMPDELVVFFTLNRQSIYGAAATAMSADGQRRLPTGEPALRIWPVPTRVDKSEQERLERARAMAREQFAQFLWHVPLTRRPDYWGSIELQYFPYYAYEETLASIADTPRHTTSLLFETERLVGHITGNKVERMELYRSGERERLLSLYQPPQSRARSRFFLSYAQADSSEGVVREFASALDRRFGPNAAFWSGRIPLGAASTSRSLPGSPSTRSATGKVTFCL